MMLDALQERDYKRAAQEMLNSLWAKQVGTRAQELAYAMEHGEYPFEVEEYVKLDKLTEWLSNKVWEDINRGW